MAESNGADIMERVKTFEDACREAGVDHAVEFSEERTKGLTADELAYKKMKVLCKAFNQGKEIDYSDNRQWKYFPWMEHEPGRGLVFGDVDCDDAGTYVGPRLSFLEKEHVEYVVKQFPDIYNAFFN
ncbi:hypothetical protein UFOVP74_4 [uncultured Caudovirales phage]|uniref:Uncharacterized protein n=1 Tax=uncultured Caudovirales phage TaxID=2100421 RepID=A0A6J5KZF5_9CAUD|nr:hypothetical protein UFOVP74_4 [uncultured Caudovirales phage]